MKTLLKIKPKTYAVGDVIKVDLMAIHPMETGLRKDKDGSIVPAHYISDIKLSFNDKVVTSIVGWETISANPYYSVSFKVPGEGVLKAVVKDNKGEVAEATSEIKPSKG